jgi:DNA ligase 1
MIKEFDDFVSKMNASTSTNEKVETMMHVSKNIRKVLYYTYNNFIQFNITSKSLIKKSDLCNRYTKFNCIFDLLESLSQRLITGHTAIKETNGFIYKYPELKYLLYLIVDRNLKIRVSSKLINKAQPNLIPTFNVALANAYDEKTKKKVNLERDVWYVSRKLDGVRCLVVVDEKGKARSFSRAGKQFHTLSLVEKDIESLGVKNVVFDGEMCVVDEEGDENFQSIMKEIKRKNHVIKNGLFQVFDYIKYEDFSKGYSNEKTLSERILTLQNLLSNKDIRYISFLEQTPILNFHELTCLSSTAATKGWEGLMLRKNDFYKGKRSNDILKVKTFHDDEYKVESLNFGPFRYVKEGKEVEEEMLSAVTIKHKGNTVNVGSGFTIDQRKRFYSKPSEIHGKIITVQYFEESQNQCGDYSLRFPVVKAIHGNKRDT